MVNHELSLSWSTFYGRAYGWGRMCLSQSHPYECIGPWNQAMVRKNEDMKPRVEADVKRKLRGEMRFKVYIKLGHWGGYLKWRSLLFTVDPYYSQIPCLWIFPFAKIYLQFQNQYSYYFAVIWGHAQSNEKIESPYIPSQLQLCILFLVLMQKQVFFLVVYLVLHFSHICAFCWWFRCLEFPPSVKLMCSLVFQTQGSCDVFYREDMYVR